MNDEQYREFVELFNQLFSTLEGITQKLDLLVDKATSEEEED